jgi:hypothetical protein
MDNIEKLKMSRLTVKKYKELAEAEKPFSLFLRTFSCSPMFLCRLPNDIPMAKAV